MAANEIHTVIKKQYMFNLAAINTNGSHLGNIAFDSAGFESIEIFINSSSTSGDAGVYTLSIRHGDSSDPGSHFPAASADLVGPTVSFIGTSINQLLSQGYVGKRRFVSVDIVATGSTSGTVAASFVVANTLRHVQP